MPSNNLQDVLVIPAGGGKTTLCEDPYYLDVDALYSLDETDETYDRLNYELERRAKLKIPVPREAVDEHRQRLAEYEGPARCLLVHSLELARQGGLNLRGAFVPDPELHDRSIEDRNTIGRWFARETRNNILSQCERQGQTPKTYGDWDTLQQIVRELRVDDRDDNVSDTAAHSTRTDSESSGSQIGNNRELDEKYLVDIVSLALGCELEKQ